MRKLQKEKERSAEDSDTREPMPTRVVRGGGESGGESGGEGGGESGGGEGGGGDGEGGGGEGGGKGGGGDDGGGGCTDRTAGKVAPHH